MRYGVSLAELILPAQAARNAELQRRSEAGEPLMTPEEVQEFLRRLASRRTW